MTGETVGSVEAAGQTPEVRTSAKGLWPWAKFALRLAFGVAIIALLARGERAREMWSHVSSVAAWGMGGGILGYVICQAISSYRWQYNIALLDRKVSYPRCVGLYYVGMFFNLFLPTGIGGDVARAIGLSKDTGSLSLSATSVFMDRNVGLAAALAVGLLAAIVHGSSTPGNVALLGHTIPSVPIWGFFCFMGAGYVCANAVLFSRTLFGWVERIGERLKVSGLVGKARRIHEALNAYRRQWPKLCFPFLVSIIYQSLEIGCVYVLALGTDLNPSILVLFYLLPMVALASILPISVGNLGVREGLYAYVLAAEGIGTAEAVALGLLYFGTQIACGIVGGIWFGWQGIEAGRTAGDRGRQDSGVRGQDSGPRD